ncbi:MAG TPA: adenylate kinase [Acidimicrobiales bacterium]|nr:adenylate kinase [Acidimicrobiales bacterium]
MLRALLVAPPGAGKGTQGTILADAHQVPHLATGDMLRAEVASGSRLGAEARQLMDQGELVPDRLVLSLVLKAITGPPALTGFVLDGFPRTLAQAEAAYEWGSANDRTFHAVISLAVPEDELVRRLLGRAGDRSDDNPDTIRHRLEVYAASTEPLVDYYRRRGVLIEVDGTGAVEEVAGRISAALAPIDLRS